VTGRVSEYVPFIFDVPVSEEYQVEQREEESNPEDNRENETEQTQYDASPSTGSLL
jgi:hypothetical protein